MLARVVRILLGCHEAEKFKALYHELLFAVGNKYPGESRHETALRYIRNAERGSDKACSAK